jgi:hypothetical protein
VEEETSKVVLRDTLNYKNTKKHTITSAEYLGYGAMQLII